MSIWGPFWGPQEGKSENRDFVKIVLPPRREHDFQGSDPPKIDQESRKTAFAAKIDKEALPGTAFCGKNRFLLIFGIPGGTQKLLKIYESFPVKGSWEPSGSHFGRFSAFFSILAPLLVHPGSILGSPGSIFSQFLQLFLFFGSIVFIADPFCFLKVFRHLLDSSHVFS